MTSERKLLLEKINTQISNKRKMLMSHIPTIHEIEDGFVIRLFSNWNSCEDNKKVKYKKIKSDDPNEIMYNFFLPKGTTLDIRKRKYAGCVICLSGHIELCVNNEIIQLKAHTKKCLNDDTYHGRVLRDTYIVTHSK